MRKNNMTALLFIALVTMIVGACSTEDEQVNANDENEEKPLQVYTTLYAWEDFTKKIGGDEVEVENVVPIGSDPHSFEPTTETMIGIAKSDAFIYNGAGMEGFAEAVHESVEEGVSIIKATEGIDLRRVTEEDHHEHHDDHDHHHGNVDPHVWLDPILAIEVAENIKNALITLRPEKEDVFAENFSTLEENLRELDKEFSDIVHAHENHKILVSHAAYGYWEDRYGLEQLSISGLSPANEPSQKKLKQLIETVNQSHIQHIMFEQNTISPVTEVVKEEAGLETLYLHNLEFLTNENMGNEEDYFSLMKRNIENVNMALQSSGHE